MRFARGNDRIYLNKEERINVYSSSVHVSRLASIGIAVKLKNFEKVGIISIISLYGWTILSYSCNGFIVIVSN